MSDPTWPDDALEVGRIGEPWGVKGWFRVHPYASDAQALRAAGVWHLEADPAPRALAPRRTLMIRTVRSQGDALVASAAGVDDRDSAEALHGTHVFVSRAQFPPTADDEFYWIDLIGLSVHNRAGERLGVVAGLLDNGQQGVLRVRADDAAGVSTADADAAAAAPERLIPFVAAYVDTVDLQRRCIVVDWHVDY